MMQYGKYKQTEIEWFKEVPAEWETFRFIDKVFLKHGFQFRDFDFTDTGIKIVKITQLNADGNLDLDNCSYIDATRLKEFKSIRIAEGDILMALTGGTIGKIIRVGKIEEPLLQNYRVGNFYPNKKALDKTYLYFLLSSQITEEQINYLLNRNGQPNIGKESFKNMFFPLPTLQEQTTIAQYLDTKTQAIDKKINLLTTKIEYYKELRKTIINNAVTKGLDNNVKLKESELGVNIANHFEIKRLKDVCKIINGYAFKSNEYLDKGLPIIRIGDINNKIDYNTVAYVAEENKLFAKESKAIKGDILMAMTGATIGKNSFFNEDRDTYLNQRVCGFRVNRNIDSNYLGHFISSMFFQDFVQLICGGSAQENISKTQLEIFKIIIPPKEEQTAIAIYLDEKTQKIDAIVANIQKQIETLKELRKTLINDVVTGKVKVTD